MKNKKFGFILFGFFSIIALCFSFITPHINKYAGAIDVTTSYTYHSPVVSVYSPDVPYLDNNVVFNNANYNRTMVNFYFDFTNDSNGNLIFSVMSANSLYNNVSYNWDGSNQLLYYNSTGKHVAEYTSNRQDVLISGVPIVLGLNRSLYSVINSYYNSDDDLEGSSNSFIFWFYGDADFNCNVVSYSIYNDDLSSGLADIDLEAINNQFTINYGTSNAIFIDRGYILRYTFIDSNGKQLTLVVYTELETPDYATIDSAVSGSETYQSGYTAGSNAGYQTGYNTGKADGNQIGYQNGYDAGYNVGVIAGASSANNYTFLGLIGAVIDAPIRAFTGLLDFEVFGVNLSNFFISLFSISLIIVIIKLILGRVGGDK